MNLLREVLDEVKVQVMAKAKNELRKAEHDGHQRGCC